ncbi:MAG: hypothetical protein WAO55_15455 [Candidatus Manganitrophaceae bacterium]
MQDDLFKGWLWEMFKEYVRKIRRTASHGAPELTEMKGQYQQIFSEASIKILVEEKVGMIVVFNELEERTTPQLEGMMTEEALMAYLARTYGRGKYKINLYHGLTFVATHNFKVLDETLPEGWREIVARNKAAEGKENQWQR